jgi:two-component system sensor histidine kinase DegS
MADHEQVYEQTIEESVKQATRILDQMEQDIGRLAEQTYRAYDTLLAQGSQDTDHRLERLVQVARQFEKLAERNAALSHYLADGMEGPPEDDDSWPRIRIIQSQEEERSRLARELEDGVGQLLANAVFELASSRYLLDSANPAVDLGLAALQAELEQGLADVRQLIGDLDPLSILGNFGLMAGLRRYLERYEARTGLQVTIDVRAIVERLPATIEVAIFRIIQEALGNVQRHANASRLDVSVYEEDGHLIFSITDDGVGLQPERIGSRRRSLGLVSMRDRIDLLQGKLRIRSDPGQGTQVIFSVPYPIL